MTIDPAFTGTRPDPAEIRRALDVLLQHGQVTELRAFEVSTPEYGGVAPRAPTSTIPTPSCAPQSPLSGRANDIYCPIDPQLLLPRPTGNGEVR